MSLKRNAAGALYSVQLPIAESKEMPLKLKVCIWRPSCHVPPRPKKEMYKSQPFGKSLGSTQCIRMKMEEKNMHRELNR